jgi:hypothetical protein
LNDVIVEFISETSLIRSYLSGLNIPHTKQFFKDFIMVISIKYSWVV